jgi:hypothetical protein
VVDVPEREIPAVTMGNLGHLDVAVRAEPPGEIADVLVVTHLRHVQGRLARKAGPR